MASSAYSTRRRRRRKQSLPRPPAVVPFNPSANRVRILLVWALLVLSLVAIAGRLAWLQLAQGDSLSSLAQQQRLTSPVQRQVRRSIADRQGNVIAVDRVVYTLYAHPQLFDLSISEMAATLSPLLESPESGLIGQFSKQPTGIRVADGLSEATVDRLRALRLNGLELTPQQQRFYPQQQLFAPIVGFVNFDGQPQAGLEIAYQDQLALTPAEAASPAETEIPLETYGPPAPGDTLEVADDRQDQLDTDVNTESDTAALETDSTASLRLTLDSRLQRSAQQELQAVVDRHNAKRGTVMVMEAQTGEMLALASVPTYDPNQYFKTDPEALKTWAVSDLYEPGSTFKPINIAIALEAGLIRPDEVVNDSGQMQFGEWKIRNHDYATAGGRGPLSITDVLKYSSNVGMVRIMQKMPAADYFSWLQRLSLDRPTGIDLPAEATAQMKDREQFVRSRVESATTAFGQGFSLSPIKMVQLLGTLANGGKLVTPHVVSGMVSADGTEVWTPDRARPKTVFSPQTTQQVLTMMEAVVSEGTGDAAKLSGYRIGGKTGTAQKATVSGGYGRGRVTSFVGILPIDSPQYVVLAVIDEPQGDDAYGSTVAAPLVKKVIEALVVLEGLPPSAAATP
ncbi:MULTISPECIES: penicillin-binding protein 2 [Cyanophyceae]|uniref:peptidoglycan D,D-transpeptidase FtsI family protein n=1 Tax=Cyanophyceae TaxID=3028117 RepID=UPI001686A3B5|nr:MULTISPECIES: penicillin-binding protein 2 [Cyanophyceae]MBD1915980.1 penicillin-binding protein 2 [Phormidium sp. FACHB-77]MBD2030346.1 penicillin-binding protein 2 [Phormidium sp. FACHB-322]MBD2053348.1 penicillin-binding protein 2 [Leptolyngbya sp. FACHB-60]